MYVFEREREPGREEKRLTSIAFPIFAHLVGGRGKGFLKDPILRFRVFCLSMTKYARAQRSPELETFSWAYLKGIELGDIGKEDQRTPSVKVIRFPFSGE